MNYFHRASAFREASTSYTIYIFFISYNTFFSYSSYFYKWLIVRLLSSRLFLQPIRIFFSFRARTFLPLTKAKTSNLFFSFYSNGDKNSFNNSNMYFKNNIKVLLHTQAKSKHHCYFFFCSCMQLLRRSADVDVTVANVVDITCWVSKASCCQHQHKQHLINSKHAQLQHQLKQQRQRSIIQCWCIDFSTFVAYRAK